MLFGYYLLGLVGVLSALVIVTALNPVHRIAILVLLFLVGSVVYIILDFYFLGLTYIIVYCGAIAILFVFVIMMVTVPHSSLSLVLFGFSLALLSNLVTYIEPFNLVNFFIPNLSIQFISLTDIHLFAILVYFAYPTALIVITIALWVVMIGIMKLTDLLRY